ncbi:hypothetical protein SLEP1_g38292 [Rubroshorea leprosula]|uniref:Uncharacterized protein n=1 Tax=Rubroshorea leprosula TaxID=152421 RepID=A0AAV5KXS9_9ROSI|nr:hypothetical protein SLEP1_g38292 [Rubroshorea leprosula]
MHTLCSSGGADRRYTKCVEVLYCIALVALLGGVSYLLSQGIDIRPNLVAILGLTFLDSIFLGGTILSFNLSSYWPPCRCQILVHEAGHLLVYPIAAMRMGIKGQAGTQFWDEKMSNELAEGRSAFDRYCMVPFAGIAAEALIYGKAEALESGGSLSIIIKRFEEAMSSG